MWEECNYRVYVDTSVCKTYSKTFSMERELSRVGLEPTALCSPSMGQLSRQCLTKRSVVFMKIAHIIYNMHIGLAKAQFPIARNKEVCHC